MLNPLAVAAQVADPTAQSAVGYPVANPNNAGYSPDLHPYLTRDGQNLGWSYFRPDYTGNQPVQWWKKLANKADDEYTAYLKKLQAMGVNPMARPPLPGQPRQQPYPGQLPQRPNVITYGGAR